MTGGSTRLPSMPADQIDRGQHLSLGQCELSPQAGERGSKATTQPGLNPRRLDDSPAKSVGQESVTNEDCKSHRHAWLGDNKFRATDPVAVTNPDLIFQQAFGSEVLTECAPRQFRIGQFRTPKAVMLFRIHVHGFFRPAVNGEIRLLVALEVVTRGMVFQNEG